MWSERSEWSHAISGRWWGARRFPTSRWRRCGWSGWSLRWRWRHGQLISFLYIGLLCVTFCLPWNQLFALLTSIFVNNTSDLAYLMDGSGLLQKRVGACTEINELFRWALGVTAQPRLWALILTLYHLRKKLKEAETMYKSIAPCIKSPI